MYLIDEQYVRDNTRIGKNTKDDVIAPYLQDVQDIHVADLLGIPLMELYLNHIQQGTEISTIKASLLKDIRKFYAKRVEFEYTLLANVKLSNKGVTSPEGAADLKAIDTVQQSIAQQYTHYQDRILTIIQRNPDEFPEYYGNPEDVPSVRNTSYLGFSFKPLVKKRYF